MAYCPNCGNNLPDGVTVCNICGTDISADMNNANSQNPVFSEPAYQPFPPVSEFDPEDIRKNNILAALCYLTPLLMIVALLLAKDSKFVRFHANQSLVLTVFGIITALVAIVPFLGWLAAVICSVMVFVFTIVGIVNAYRGDAKELPLIGKYRIIKD